MGAAVIDFVMFEARILGKASGATRCKIPILRFWRLLVGIPDFTEGGGRYTEALRRFRRNGRTNRKIPITIAILEPIESLRDDPMRPHAVGI